MPRIRRREVTIMGASGLLGAIGANLDGARPISTLRRCS